MKRRTERKNKENVGDVKKNERINMKLKMENKNENEVKMKSKGK